MNHPEAPEIRTGGEYMILLHLKATVLDSVGLQAKRLGGFHFTDDWDEPMRIPRVALPDHIAQYLDAVAKMLSDENVRIVPTGQVLEVRHFHREPLH
jgi:hypothetical protein